MRETVGFVPRSRVEVSVLQPSLEAGASSSGQRPRPRSSPQSSASARRLPDRTGAHLLPDPLPRDCRTTRWWILPFLEPRRPPGWPWWNTTGPAWPRRKACPTTRPALRGVPPRPPAPSVKLSEPRSRAVCDKPTSSILESAPCFAISVHRRRDFAEIVSAEIGANRIFDPPGRTRVSFEAIGRAEVEKEVRRSTTCGVNMDMARISHRSCSRDSRPWQNTSFHFRVLQ